MIDKNSMPNRDLVVDDPYADEAVAKVLLDGVLAQGMRMVDGGEGRISIMFAERFMTKNLRILLRRYSDTIQKLMDAEVVSVVEAAESLFTAQKTKNDANNTNNEPQSTS